MMKFKTVLSTLLLSGLLIAGSHAQATVLSYTVTGTQPHPDTDSLLSAQADFEVIGGSQLEVTISNISGDDIEVPRDILQAMFFSMRDDINLSLTSAVIDSGSERCDFNNATPCSSAGGTDITAYWDYVDDMGTEINGGDRGIGAAGLGIFSGPAIDGMDYGILSQGDDPISFNGGMVNKSPFVKNSAKYTFDMNGSGAPSVSSAGDLQLSNISFNYGTDLNTIPNPGSAALLLLGLVLGGWIRRRTAIHLVTRRTA